MDKQQLLENYFSHLLDPEQEKLLRKLLVTDPDFKKQFDFERDLKRVIKNKKNKDLKTTLNRFESDIQQKSSAGSKGIYKIWAVAASLLLLVGLSWFGYNNAFGTDYTAMYEENFQSYPNTVFAITRSDTIASIEREAFVAYESGNFQTAIDNFGKIATSDQKTYLDFYSAQSYLQLGKTAETQKYFLRNIRSGSAFVPESHWYLALTYLKEKDKDNAILQLQELVSHYDYNRKKAESLLRELE